MNPDVFVGLNEHVFSTIPSVGYICGKKLDASNAVYGTLVITSRHLLLVLKSSAIRFLPSFIDRVLNMGLKKVRGLDLRPNVIGLFTSKVEKIEGGSFAVTTKDFPAETKKPEHFLFSASFSDHRIFSEIEQSIEIGRDPRKLEKAIADKSKLFVEEAIQLTSDSEVVLLDQACFRLEIERTSHMEFVLTSDRILMRHICWHDPSSWKMFRWNDIESIQPIPVFYADVAFEMGLFSGASYMLVFGSKTTRDDAVQIMKSKASNMCKESVDELQRAWRHDKITTRDYLIAINRMGGRSMNNIMRYPIFPWILSMDPDVESMDFENDSMFRDLKKPMIFQNVDMIQYTKTLDFIPCPTHVERIASMLCCARPELRFRYETMDGAKFHNLSKLWHRSAKEGRGNMEAIPEFYKGDGQMFLDVEDPSHIIIPKWASDPEEFVRLNEMALEDERVSMGLPTWLDVTFGTSQVHASYKGWKSGCAYDPSILAKRADTLLFSSIYETSLWKRPTMPLQIFDRPHVSKKVKLVETSDQSQLLIELDELIPLEIELQHELQSRVDCYERKDDLERRLKQLEESQELLKARRLETSKKWERVLRSRMRKTENWPRINFLMKEVEQLIKERDELAQKGMEALQHHEKYEEEAKVFDGLLRSTEKSIRLKEKLRRQIENIELENIRMRASIEHVDALIRSKTEAHSDSQDAGDAGDASN